MRKVIAIALIALLCKSCAIDPDDVNDCDLIDIAGPSLYVRFIDSTGANLIESRTIEVNTISVDGDFADASFQFNPANEFAIADASIRAFDNSLKLFIANEASFQYEINIADFETLALDFTAVLTKAPCDITYYTPTAVTFNEENITLTEISSLKFLVILEL